MIEDFRGLGLSYYESRVLESVLKERLSLRELSRKSGVPFGKIYSVVKSLKEKGLINETNSRPKLIYIENASEILSALIKEKQEKDHDAIERIKDLATEIDKSKGKSSRFFEIGTSVHDNKRIQLRTFVEAEKEVLQILNIYHKPKMNRLSKTLWENEIEKAIKRGVVFKSIYPKKTVLPNILKKLNKDKPDKFQIRRLDTDFARCDIIDGRKVLVKLVSADPLQFGGIFFVENQRLAENLIKIFNEMWQQAD